ncbi:concanavalin A-like lectin/glucanase domain, Serine/threonine-protein kinase pim-1/2/3 [Artemisia annua]|uniref:Concanavalin A-like lectin/glucanase domain, Serine/threonine-protein kinase pim-1/2/3 n=1 Tax=Artemisia annua TaxID=35608 RepID=A0A2U1LNL8_ARTAN|nr:concanavalin A-like lectin/glucanase domain, Serine/threonine-protein kinase pim-1/2/3 [Artemisia annua]
MTICRILPPAFSPESSPSPFAADGPSQLSLIVPDIRHYSYHLSLVSGLGIAITAVTAMMVKKKRELDGHDITSDETSMKAISQPAKKFQEGPSCMFKKFSFKETKKASNNFGIIIGGGGFGTIFRAQFSDGSTLAVKRMNKVSDQAVEEFYKEIELLARLHHCHIVALKGFWIEKHERSVHKYGATNVGMSSVPSMWASASTVDPDWTYFQI